MLTQKLESARANFKSSHGQSELRRLNSWEYRQDLGDLLGLNVDVWNPAEDFPAEVKVEGFDNNGASPVTSGILLQHYFKAAEEAIKRATHFEETTSFSSLCPATSPFTLMEKRLRVS